VSAPCPTCHLTGGFHDSKDKDGHHARHQAPREVLKESGWAQAAHEELRREQARQRAEAEEAAWLAKERTAWLAERQYEEPLDDHVEKDLADSNRTLLDTGDAAR
jgi:hypothetical protein